MYSKETMLILHSVIEQCKQASRGNFLCLPCPLLHPRFNHSSHVLQELLAGTGSLGYRALFLFVFLFFTQKLALYTNSSELAFLLSVSWGVFLLKYKETYCYNCTCVFPSLLSGSLWIMTRIVFSLWLIIGSITVQTLCLSPRHMCR